MRENLRESPEIFSKRRAQKGRKEGTNEVRTIRKWGERNRQRERTEVGGLECRPEKSSEAMFCNQCCQMAKFDPFLSLDCARVEGMGDQILPSGNTDCKTWPPNSSPVRIRGHRPQSALSVCFSRPICVSSSPRSFLPSFLRSSFRKDFGRLSMIFTQPVQ